MKKLFNSFKYAFQGFSYAAKSQLNFRVHLVITVLAVLTGWLLHISGAEWLWILLTIALVLAV